MKTVKRVEWLFLMLALCFTLAACAGEAGGDTGNGRKEDDAVADGRGEGAEEAGDTGNKEPEGPAEVGDDYRDFTATLIDGSTFTLSDYEGGVVLVNFWATWCGPCVREMPAFPRLLEKYGEDLTLIAVDAGESEKTVKSFLEKYGYDFPVALDQEGEISSLYPSDGIPYTILIGRDGKIASIHLGAYTADVMYETYCEEIDGLLEE